MRHGENIYLVVEDDKEIFEGTAREICVHLLKKNILLFTNN